MSGHTFEIFRVTFIDIDIYCITCKCVKLSFRVRNYNVSIFDCAILNHYF